MIRRAIQAFVASALIFWMAVPGVSAAAPFDPRVADEILRLLQNWPDASRVRVDLPLGIYREFLRMEKLGPPGKIAPIPYIIDEQIHALRLDDDGAELTVTFKITVLEPKLAGPVLLLPRVFAFREVMVDGQSQELMPVSPLVFRQQNLPEQQAAPQSFVESPHIEGQAGAAQPRTLSGWLAWTPPNRGSYTIVAKAKVKPTQNGAVYSLDYPRRESVRTLIKVLSNRAMEVASPDSPGHIVGDINGTSGELVLRPAPRMLVTWQPPLPRPDHAPELSTTCLAACDFAPGAIEVHARLDVLIRRGKTDRLVLELPAGADRVTVTGPDVRSVSGAASQRTVHLGREIWGATRLNLSFDLPRPANRGKVNLGYFGVQGARAEGGYLIVSNSGGGELLEDEHQRLEATAFFGLPDALSGLSKETPMLAFSIKRGRWELNCDVVVTSEIKLPPTIIDQAEHTVVFRGDGNAIARVLYRVRNRERQFLRVRLPEGSVLMLALVDEAGVAVTPTGKSEIILPLKRSLATVDGLISFPVEIIYRRRALALERRGGLRLPLPHADAPVAYSTCRLYVPEEFDFRDWRGSMQHVPRFAEEREHEDMIFGRGHTDGSPAALPKPPGELLGRNYWQAGYRAYAGQDLHLAKEQLENAIRVAPESEEAANARKLLSNIQVVSGLGKAGGGDGKSPGDRLARAQKAQIGRSLQAGAEEELSQQKWLFNEGKKLAEAGRSREAAEAFGGAILMGEKLRERGVDGREQEAIIVQSRQHLQKELEVNKKVLDVQERVVELAKQIAEPTDQERLSGEGEKHAKDEDGLALREGPRKRTAALERLVKDFKEEKALGEVLESLAQEKSIEDIEDRDGTSPSKPDEADAGLHSEGQHPSSSARRVLMQRAMKQLSSDEQPTVRDDVRDSSKALRRAEEQLDQLAEQAEIMKKPRSVKHPPRATEPKVLSPATPQPAPASPADTPSEMPSGTVTRSYSLEALASQDADGKVDPEKARALTLLVTQTVAPGGWTNTATQGAATMGSVLWKEDRLVVTHTPEVQQQVQLLLRNLDANWGQKINVSSFNNPVDASLRSLVQFQAGDNDARYAVVDEGVVRTLIEGGQRTGRWKGFADNPTQQDVVVGNDAPLANDLGLNVAASTDDGNRFQYLNNAIFVPHDKYLLIDNGTYYTIVAGTASHEWRERIQPRRVVLEVAPRIDLPRVGRVVKFEKTLIQPGDEAPVLEANYRFRKEVR